MLDLETRVPWLLLLSLHSAWVWIRKHLRVSSDGNFFSVFWTIWVQVSVTVVPWVGPELLEQQAVSYGMRAMRGNDCVPRLFSGLLVRGRFFAARFGPELLLELLYHPLQVLPGLPLLQQVGSELLAVGLGVLQLHLEVLDLINREEKSS